MNRPLFFFVAIFFFFGAECAFASELGELFLLPQAQNKKISFKISKLNSLSVSSSCKAKSDSCLKLIAKWVKASESDFKGGDPAAHYCVANKGVVVILTDKVGNQYTYCQIGSDYLVDAWDLYALKKESSP